MKVLATQCVLAAALAVSLIAQFGRDPDMLAWFNLTPWDSLYGGFGDFSWGQPWRLVTASLLHFGILHLVFNAVFIFLLGRVVEFWHGVRQVLLVMAVTSSVGLLGEHLLSGSTVIGGLSAAVYGLWAYLLVRARIDQTYMVPIGVSVALMINLVLGYLGVLDMLTQGRVANHAHLLGAVAGAALGYTASSQVTKS